MLLLALLGSRSSQISHPTPDQVLRAGDGSITLLPEASASPVP